VGLLVLLAAVAVLAGVMWITDTDIGGERFRFTALAPDAAQVSTGARVYLHGVDVGSVSDVGLGDRGVAVGLDVSGDVEIPRDSRAVIEPSGFLGSQLVRLVPGGAQETLSAGDTIAAGTGPSLQSVATRLGGRAEDVLDRTARVLSDSTVRALRTGAGDLSGTLRELRGLVRAERESIGRLLETLNRTSDNLARATEGPELERTVTRLDSLARELNRTSEGLTASSESLASILEKTDRGEGSLGKLVNDDRLYERVTAAAENLQSASEEVAALSKDIRQRPERYLEGISFSLF
jgi:phospholipid/cholesterol/gamma-HCH transport system substrate-binding protein